MSEMVGGGSKYTDEQRKQAVVEYCLKGVDESVSEATGIPRSTITYWRNNADWWDIVAAEVQQQITDKQRAQLTEIVDKAHEQVIDRIENGDEVHTRDGLKRIKMRGKDLATVAGIGVDKIRTINGLPNSYASKAEGMAELKAEFIQIAESYREKNARVVAHQEKRD